MSQDRIPFNMPEVESELTLIPVGKYVGYIEGAKLVDMPDNSTKLWLGVRIDGPKQANRYITTLLTLDDASPSAYKTASLIKAIAAQQGGAYLPADPTALIGLRVGIDITHWTPRTTGIKVAEIRSFIESAAPLNRVEKVMEIVNGLANDLSMDNKLSKAPAKPADASSELDF